MAGKNSATGRTSGWGSTTEWVKFAGAAIALVTAIVGAMHAPGLIGSASPTPSPGGDRTPQPTMTATAVPANAAAAVASNPTAPALTPPCGRLAPAFQSLTEETLQSLGCTLGGWQTVHMREMAFESGAMIWLASDNQILTFMTTERTWDEHPDPLQGGAPGAAKIRLSIPETPGLAPLGVYHPQGGIDALWDKRNLLGRIGWARCEQEHDYNGVRQTFAHGYLLESSFGTWIMSTRMDPEALDKTGTYDLQSRPRQPCPT